MRTIIVMFLIAAIGAFSPTSAQPTQQPFVIAISTDKPVVKAGADVWVKVRVTNTSTRTIDASANIDDMIGVNPNYVFDVRDSSGNQVSKRVYKHPELATGSPIFRSLKPGESLVDEQDLSRLDDLSEPGQYVIQVSQRVSEQRKDELVRSNTITITVSDDDSLIERSTPPFALVIDGYAMGETGDHVVVKPGTEVGINITKRNTSKHEIDCSGSWSNITGLDEKYRYDVRDGSGNPVGKHTIEHPIPFMRGPNNSTCKPGGSGGSGANTITRLYDLSRPGDYTIQVSQPISDHPEDGVVKSNTITVTVTD